MIDDNQYYTEQTKELIINALQYYDINYGKNVRTFNKFKYYSLTFTQNDLEHNRIIFYDENKKKIFESDYEIMGVYDVKSNIYMWSWSIPQLWKNMINIARKVLLYGIDLETNAQFLKGQLITSRFIISNNIQLEFFMALSTYLSKIPNVYKLIRNFELIQKNEFPDEIFPLSSSMDNSDTVYFLFLLDSIK